MALRSWCTRCLTHLGTARATLRRAEIDAQVHAVVSGHPTLVYDVVDGRTVQHVAGEPPLPFPWSVE